MILAGNTTTGIESSYFIEDRRRIIAQANLRFINAAEQLGPLAVYIVEPGGSLRGLDPVSIVGTASTLLTPTPPGDYEMVLRDSDTSTRVAGRLPITLLGRRNYGILAVNAPGGSTADIVLFDDF